MMARVGWNVFRWTERLVVPPTARTGNWQDFLVAYRLINGAKADREPCYRVEFELVEVLDADEERPDAV